MLSDLSGFLVWVKAQQNIGMGSGGAGSSGGADAEAAKAFEAAVEKHCDQDRKGEPSPPPSPARKTMDFAAVKSGDLDEVAKVAGLQAELASLDTATQKTAVLNESQIALAETRERLLKMSTAAAQDSSLPCD